MLRRSHALLGLFLAAAACGTPQERCIGEVSRDLRTLDTLIVQTQGNLDRGFAVEERIRYVADWEWCHSGRYVRDREGRLVPAAPVMCMRDRPVTRRVPVAIDLEAEKRKLESLKSRRSDLARQTAQEVEQCRILHPAQPA